MDDASLDTRPDIPAKRDVIVLAGRVAAPLVLLLVVLQFAVVIARTFFGETALWLQESVVYAHAAMIVLGVGWTLAENRHVRIDALKSRVSDEFQGLVERVGLIATLAASVVIAILSWGFVATSWRVLEGSREVGGLPGVFVLKTLVLLLFILVGVAAFQRLRAIR